MAIYINCNKEMEVDVHGWRGHAPYVDVTLRELVVDEDGTKWADCGKPPNIIRLTPNEALCLAKKLLNWVE